MQGQAKKTGVGSLSFLHAEIKDRVENAGVSVYTENKYLYGKEIFYGKFVGCCRYAEGFY